IQYNYGGQIKFGIWWIDCGTFTIDSIKVYTTGGTTTTTTTTTTKTTTTTTTTTKVPSAGLKGDANGDGSVDIADVIAIAAYVANPSQNSLSSAQINNADVHNTGDGITANDALKIQQYLANIGSL
ncbi:MAG: dockerin type I domain-containing protein, partial [Ruminococcus sp.]